MAAPITAATKTGLAYELQKLRNKAKEFLRAQSHLNTVMPDRTKYPAEYERWLTLKNYGDQVRSRVQAITGAVDTAGNVMDSIWYGVTHPFGMDIGLGVLPLLPIAGVAISGAVIASSLAAMTYFISNAYTFAKFADATPENKAQLVAFEKAQSAGGIGGALSSVKGIMLIGVLVFVAPKIYAEMKRRK